MRAISEESWGEASEVEAKVGRCGRLWTMESREIRERRLRAQFRLVFIYLQYKAKTGASDLDRIDGIPSV